MRKVVMRDGENDFIGGMIFHKRVKRIIEFMVPQEELVIDLNLLYLDSSVIGTLLAILTTCKKKEIHLVLKNLSEESEKVLKITGVLKILTIKGDASEEVD